LVFPLKKINILFLITTFQKDGPGNVLLNIVKNLPKESYNIIVACLYRPGKVQALIEKEGIKTLNMNQKGVLKGWLDIRALIKIRRILIEQHIDIIHTHLIRADIYGRLAAIRFDKPFIITTIHNLDFYRKEKKYFFLKLLDSYLSKFNDKIITVSKSVMDFTIQNQNIPPCKFVIIYNSIDIEQFKPSPRNNKLNNSNFTVGFLGRLHKQKNLTTLLKAIELVYKENRRIKLLIGGQGPEKEKLLKIANNLNLMHTVTFLDYVSDVVKFFTQIDIFVLSSIIEGHPLVLLEAMASGLPCVSTDAGGISETIINGESGFVVEKSNPTQLAKRIVEITNNTQLQEKMGRKGREIVEKKFNSVISAQKHHWLYKSLIE
jgi:glycosyltransferase involved in cell wall biosynthesis